MILMSEANHLECGSEDAALPSGMRPRSSDRTDSLPVSMNRRNSFAGRKAESTETLRFSTPNRITPKYSIKKD